VLACGAAPPHVRRWLQAPTSAADYAHDLYANLRALDKENAARILIEQVPASPEWDAVRDRLGRAAAR
jgi:L-threonylcarbamoyladenylate synthase